MITEPGPLATLFKFLQHDVISFHDLTSARHIHDDKGFWSTARYVSVSGEN